MGENKIIAANRKVKTMRPKAKAKGTKNRPKMAEQRLQEVFVEEKYFSPQM